MSRADTIDEIRKRLLSLLQQRRDIAWARLSADGPDEKSSIVKLVVMPSEPWWSGLERQNLAGELERLLGRYIHLEDERAVHPRRFQELKDEWELLIDRDVGRRLDVEHERLITWLSISEFQHSSKISQDRGLLSEFLQSSAIREENSNRFKRILDFATTEDLFGPEFIVEDDWGRISNAAQEAGRQVLALCCDVISLYRFEGPRSTTDALGFLVDKDFLDSDCAVRLAGWLSYALPREVLVVNDLARVGHLLEIRSDDLSKFSDAVSRAAASYKETKREFPRSEVLAFDLQAALAGLTELMEQTSDRTERELISLIRSGVLNRLADRTSAEDFRLNPESVFAQPPVRSLLVLQTGLCDSLFPRRIAHALYGDGSLVYDIGKTLEAATPKRQFDAVWGRSKTFSPIGIVSLPEFIEVHGRAVVFSQDAARAEPKHLSCLAGVADAQLRSPTGGRVFVGNTCLIVCGQFPIGTPREIDFHGSHGDQPPLEFCQRIEDDAAIRSPEHLSASIRSRFYVRVDCIWERYLQLVASGSLDEPLVRPFPITHVKKPLLVEPPVDEVEDVTRLIQVSPEPNKFDFFVSYSWTRTESEAHELAKILKSRGHSVFLDKEEIVKSSISMEGLVQELVKAVRSSTAVLLFPIQLKEPIADLAGDEEVELQHGRAIQAPALGGGGTVLSEWSWQTLELLAAARYLVVQKHRAYAVAHERSDPDFIARRCQSVEELADACEAYLELRRQQGVG